MKLTEGPWDKTPRAAMSMLSNLPYQPSASSNLRLCQWSYPHLLPNRHSQSPASQNADLSPGILAPTHGSKIALAHLPEQIVPDARHRKAQRHGQRELRDRRKLGSNSPGRRQLRPSSILGRRRSEGDGGAGGRLGLGRSRTSGGRRHDDDS